MGRLDHPTPLYRLRHRVRTVATEHPRLYLPFARRKYPGPSPSVISDATELVIDGYTRSASTFAVYAFQLAQPRPVRIAHHLHAPAQLIAGVRMGLPVLALIRRPRSAVLSQLAREPDVQLADALYAYRRFHASLLPWLNGMVVADFDEVTTDFGAVIRRLNARFGTGFGVYAGDDQAAAEINALVALRDHLSPVLLGFESGTVGRSAARAEAHRLARLPAAGGAWLPNADRERAKDTLLALWNRPELTAPRRAADEIYLELRARTGRPAPAVDGSRP
jgi:hypothetical protein